LLAVVSVIPVVVVVVHGDYIVAAAVCDGVARSY
jgi:hypothetical protein